MREKLLALPDRGMGRRGLERRRGGPTHIVFCFFSQLPAEWPVGSHPSSRKLYGLTRNTTLLLSVPVLVVTTTLPVVAPLGTLARIWVLEITRNVAATPLKVTLVEPSR